MKNIVNTKPRWLSDSDMKLCYKCHVKFSPIVRRHHCRRCGLLFCNDCSNEALLIPREQQLPDLPVSYNPERVCIDCSTILHPLQMSLKTLFSETNSCMHIDRETNSRYFSLPTSLFTSNSMTMEKDITSAVYTLYNFTSDNAIEGSDRIPKSLLRKARGIVFLTVAKAGFIVSGRYGSGIVIARLDQGRYKEATNQWSAPSAIGLTGVGMGFQVGGEVMNVILILRTQSAVNVFKTGAQVSLGAGLSVSVGPVGRAAETEVHAGSAGATAAYSYAHCKGAFAGLSLEASIMGARDDVNRSYYGDNLVTPAMILSGEVPNPKGADELYVALDEVLGINSKQHLDAHSEYRPISNKKKIKKAKKSYPKEILKQMSLKRNKLYHHNECEYGVQLYMKRMWWFYCDMNIQLQQDQSLLGSTNEAMDTEETDKKKHSSIFKFEFKSLKKMKNAVHQLSWFDGDSKTEKNKVEVETSVTDGQSNCANSAVNLPLDMNDMGFRRYVVKQLLQEEFPLVPVRRQCSHRTTVPPESRDIWICQQTRDNRRKLNEKFVLDYKTRQLQLMNPPSSPHGNDESEGLYLYLIYPTIEDEIDIGTIPPYDRNLGPCPAGSYEHLSYVNSAVELDVMDLKEKDASTSMHDAVQEDEELMDPGALVTPTSEYGDVLGGGDGEHPLYMENYIPNTDTNIDSDDGSVRNADFSDTYAKSLEIPSDMKLEPKPVVSKFSKAVGSLTSLKTFDTPRSDIRSAGTSPSPANKITPVGVADLTSLKANTSTKSNSNITSISTPPLKANSMIGNSTESYLDILCDYMSQEEMCVLELPNYVSTSVIEGSTSTLNHMHVYNKWRYQVHYSINTFKNTSLTMCSQWKNNSVEGVYTSCRFFNDISQMESFKKVRSVEEELLDNGYVMNSYHTDAVYDPEQAAKVQLGFVQPKIVMNNVNQETPLQEIEVSIVYKVSKLYPFSIQIISKPEDVDEPLITVNDQNNTVCIKQCVDTRVDFEIQRIMQQKQIEFYIAHMDMYDYDGVLPGGITHDIESVTPSEMEREMQTSINESMNSEQHIDGMHSYPPIQPVVSLENMDLDMFYQEIIDIAF